MRRIAVAAAVAVMLLVGTPVQAAWTAQAAIDVPATAAGVGLAQTGDLGGLAHTYDPRTPALAAAAPLAVRNTGSRAAVLTVTVSATGATVPTLPGAVQVTAGTVGSAAACTASTAPAAGQSGTLAGTFVYTLPTLLAAGATAVVCLRTALTTAAAESFGATSLQVTATPALRYAPGAAWTAAGTARTAAQQVASTLQFFEDSAGRYLMSLRDAAGTPVCVYRRESAGAVYPVRASDCIGSTSQWRLSSAGTRLWFIAEAVNSAPSATERRWQAAGQASIGMAPPQAVDAQRWQIIGRGDGTYSVVSAATGACAALSSATVWPAGPGFLTTAVCDLADQRQAFTFAPVGTPVPPQAFALVCSGNPYYLEQTWPENTGYQAEAVYQVLLNGTVVATQPNGYNPRWQVGNQDAALQAFVAARGDGLFQVEVRQSVSGSAWQTYATGTVRITHVAPGDNRLACT